MRDSGYLTVDVIPTGSVSLDVALGVGGVPRGFISEIFGPEGCGKTTLAQHIIAEAQNQGGTGAFIDMEHALDPSYAQACGVDVENLLLAQPATGEQAFDIANTLIQSKAVDVIVIDSVAALVPRAELQSKMGEEHTGSLARLMTQALRKIGRAIKGTDTAVIFTNQIRDRISSKHRKAETTTGGKALKFHAAVRMELSQVEPIKMDSKIIGNHTSVRIIKNQVSLAHQTTEFVIIYDQGISKISDIINLAIDLEIIYRKNSMHYYKGKTLAQDLNKIEERLHQDRSLAEAIERSIRKKCLPRPPMPLET